MAKNKTVLIGLSVAIVVAVVYFVFLRGDGATEALLTSGGEGLSSMSASAQADRELLEMLQQLNSIKLDSSIFASPVFRSLEDFRVEPAPDVIGRQNPFAPVGSN